MNIKTADNKISLIELYGANAIDKVLMEVDKLKRSSSTDFSEGYIELGLSYLNKNCKDILNSKQEKTELSILVIKSFDEANTNNKKEC